MSKQQLTNTLLLGSLAFILACGAWVGAEQAKSVRYTQILPEQRIYISDANNGVSRLEVTLQQRRNLAQVLGTIH